MASHALSIARDRLRRGAAALLEAGDVPSSVVTRTMAAAWDACVRRHLRRPLPKPVGAHVVGIGSACLGGAGKTPLSIALARAWAAEGKRVAIVAHAYRADSAGPRVIHPADRPPEVGDDAVACARATRDTSVVVVSGPTRGPSIALAARKGAQILVLDGILQARPRLDWSLLVLDARVGFGRGAPPPLGDLRGEPDTLAEACDAVVVIRDRAAPSRLPAVPIARPTVVIDADLDGAVGPRGERLAVDELRRLRVGTILGIARPERVGATLQARGIRPMTSIELADHPRLDARALDRIVATRIGRAGSRPDLLLTTARCAVNLPPTIAGVPVWALVQTLDPTPLLASMPWH